LASLNNNLPEVERNIFGIERELSPQEQELQAQLYENFAPRYAEAELANLRGAGGQTVREADSISREIDPEFYNTRTQMAERLQELLQGGLTGGEQTAIERGLRGSGIDRGVDNVQTNTEQFRHAAEYGGAARDRLGQALQMATQSLPSFRTTSGAQIQGQASGALQNINNPLNRSAREGSTNLGQMANSFLGQQAGIQEAEMGINANRRTVSDHVGQAWQQSGLGGATSSCASCWIFKFKYHKDVPQWVRWARDFFYQQDKDIRKGYVRMSLFIIPLMRRFKFVENFVDKFCIQPLVQYGGWMYRIKGYEDCEKFVNYKIFWIGFWRILGKI